MWVRGSWDCFRHPLHSCFPVLGCKYRVQLVRQVGVGSEKTYDCHAWSPCQSRAAGQPGSPSIRTLLGKSSTTDYSPMMDAEHEPNVMHMGAGAAAVPAAADQGAGAGAGMHLPLHQRLPGLHPEHELRRVQRRAAQGRCHRHPGDHPRSRGRVCRAVGEAGSSTIPILPIFYPADTSDQDDKAVEGTQSACRIFSGVLQAPLPQAE